MNNLQNDLLLIKQIENAPDSALTQISENALFKRLNQDYSGNPGNQTPTEPPQTDPFDIKTGQYNPNNGPNNQNFDNNQNNGYSQSGNSNGIPPGYNPGYRVNMGNILSPVLIVEMIDNVLPALMVMALGFFDMKMKRSEFQASQSQKDALIEPTKNLMASLNITTATPMQAFLISIAGIYGSNAAEKITMKYLDDQDKKAAKKEQAARDIRVNENVVVDQNTGESVVIKKSGRGGYRPNAGRKAGS